MVGSTPTWRTKFNAPLLLVRQLGFQPSAEGFDSLTVYHLHLCVAQSGQSTPLGREWSLVRIQPRRPKHVSVAEWLHAVGCNPSDVGSIPTRDSNKVSMASPLVAYTCVQCGVEKRGSRHSSKLLFCSQLCQHTHARVEYIERWLRGEETGHTPTFNVTLPVRKWLFEEASGRCTKCGWSEVNPTTGKIPLQVNHIDGDHKNCRRSNLELICPNCHSLTPNFGALNKGKGRKERKRNAPVE